MFVLTLTVTPLLVPLLLRKGSTTLLIAFIRNIKALTILLLLIPLPLTPRTPLLFITLKAKVPFINVVTAVKVIILLITPYIMIVTVKNTTFRLTLYTLTSITTNTLCFNITAFKSAR